MKKDESPWGGVHIGGSVTGENVVVGNRASMHVEQTRVVDPVTLAAEVSQLRAAILAQGIGTAEELEALGMLADAEQQACAGDGSKAAGMLRSAAATIGRVVTDVGIKVGTAELSHLLGLP